MQTPTYGVAFSISLQCALSLFAFQFTKPINHIKMYIDDEDEDEDKDDDEDEDSAVIDTIDYW